MAHPLTRRQHREEVLRRALRTRPEGTARHARLLCSPRAEPGGGGIRDPVANVRLPGLGTNFPSFNSERPSLLTALSIAGSDTSATAIRATLLHVITNPAVHARLLAEIAAATDASRPVISDAQARDLPYLQAVIKEGLRIFPPVAGLMAKEVPTAGDVWDGRFIPGGTRVGWSVWAMFRREETWGRDSEEFRPERWMLAEDGGTCASAERLREMEAVVDFVFSYGRYQCLGRPVAVMELNKIFFEVSLSPPLSAPFCS